MKKGVERNGYVVPMLMFSEELSISLVSKFKVGVSTLTNKYSLNSQTFVNVYLQSKNRTRILVKYKWNVKMFSNMLKSRNYH